MNAIFGEEEILWKGSPDSSLFRIDFIFSWGLFQVGVLILIALALWFNFFIGFWLFYNLLNAFFIIFIEIVAVLTSYFIFYRTKYYTFILTPSRLICVKRGLLQKQEMFPFQDVEVLRFDEILSIKVGRGLFGRIIENVGSIGFKYQDESGFVRWMLWDHLKDIKYVKRRVYEVLPKELEEKFSDKKKMKFSRKKLLGIIIAVCISSIFIYYFCLLSIAFFSPSLFIQLRIISGFFEWILYVPLMIAIIFFGFEALYEGAGGIEDEEEDDILAKLEEIDKEFENGTELDLDLATSSDIVWSDFKRGLKEDKEIRRFRANIHRKKSETLIGKFEARSDEITETLKEGLLKGGQVKYQSKTVFKDATVILKFKRRMTLVTLFVSPDQDPRKNNVHLHIDKFSMKGSLILCIFCLPLAPLVAFLFWLFPSAISEVLALGWLGLLFFIGIFILIPLFIVLIFISIIVDLRSNSIIWKQVKSILRDFREVPL